MFCLLALPVFVFEVKFNSLTISSLCLLSAIQCLSFKPRVEWLTKNDNSVPYIYVLFIPYRGVFCPAILYTCVPKCKQILELICLYPKLTKTVFKIYKNAINVMLHGFCMQVAYTRAEHIFIS